mmetsp:Transcript_3756/g.12163  ORF Transcript_3756/g.12163 Transcript_3756/m.12163 type:complete len:218 (-) Transcript_3756:92-745(-)
MWRFGYTRWCCTALLTQCGQSTRCTTSRLPLRSSFRRRSEQSSATWASTTPLHPARRLTVPCSSASPPTSSTGASSSSRLTFSRLSRPPRPFSSPCTNKFLPNVSAVPPSLPPTAFGSSRRQRQRVTRPARLPCPRVNRQSPSLQPRALPTHDSSRRTQRLKPFAPSARPSRSLTSTRASTLSRPSTLTRCGQSPSVPGSVTSTFRWSTTSSGQSRA